MLVSWHRRLWRTLQLGGTGAAKRSEQKGYHMMFYTSPASDSQTRLALAPDEAIPCAFVTFSPFPSTTESLWIPRKSVPRRLELRPNFGGTSAAGQFKMYTCK